MPSTGRSKTPKISRASARNCKKSTSFKISDVVSGGRETLFNVRQAANAHSTDGGNSTTKKVAVEVQQPSQGIDEEEVSGGGLEKEGDGSDDKSTTPAKVNNTMVSGP